MRLKSEACAQRARPFLLLNELAARNLVNANLHLSLKPLVMGKHLRDSFLHKLVRSAAGLGREGVKLGFLLLGQMHFHTPSG